MASTWLSSGAEALPAALLAADARLLEDVISDVSSVTVKESAGMKRGLFAARDIKAGESIFIEPAFAWQLTKPDGQPGELCAPGVSDVALDAALLQLAPFHYNKEIVQSGTAEAVPRSELLQRVLEHNAFGVGASAEGTVVGSTFAQGGEGRGLYLLLSMVNHSCLPNARASQLTADFDAENPPVYALEARNDIAAGEEIFISYVPVTWRRGTRLSRLHMAWGFVCKCPRCEAVGDDTIVTRCPHCEDGRVYWGAAACCDCGKDVDTRGTPAEHADEESQVADIMSGGTPKALVTKVLHHPVLAHEDVRIFLLMHELIPQLLPAPGLQEEVLVALVLASRRMPFVRLDEMGIDLSEGAEDEGEGEGEEGAAAAPASSARGGAGGPE